MIFLNCLLKLDRLLKPQLQEMVDMSSVVSVSAVHAALILRWVRNSIALQPTAFLKELIK